MSKRSHRLSATGMKPESFHLMTPKTKDFIQKICYKKTASVDMTQYGFITESKMGLINAYVKPLREQIQKIVESSEDTEDKTIIRSRRSMASAVTRDKAPSPSHPSFSIDSSVNKYVKHQQKSVVFSL